MICSAENTVIPSRGKGIVKTDLSIAIPHGTYARVAPRSGLAVKNFIDTGAGVIDEDYRGNVGVVLFNHSEHDFEGNTNAFMYTCLCFVNSQDTKDLAVNMSHYLSDFDFRF